MKNSLAGIKYLLFHNKTAQAATILFIILTGWWAFVHPFNSEIFVDQKNYWSSSYILLSLYGGICGIVISRYWGGFKSVIGRAILALSVGLLLQAFGQAVYNYYTLFAGIQTPYPSLGDVGYFGSIPAYIYGAYLLARASGVRVTVKAFHNKLLAVLLPILLLTISYAVFLREYKFEEVQALTVFLDFGYPLGQAIYVSIALLTVMLSWSVLGGMMKKPVILLLVALIVQYLCDFDFLYKAHHETWYAGGIGDYFYAVSYLLMTLAIIYIGRMFGRIKES